MPRDLSTFATEAYPLHCSGLRSVLECPWRAAFMHIFDPLGEGGVAGDTGSATHVAVASFHRGKEHAACLDDMGGRRAEYPLADLADAAAMFLAYAADSRNYVETALVEEPVAFTIEPSPEDPTGQKIHVVGRLDQVRVVDGRYYLLDLKTSKKDPATLLNAYTQQIAGYCVGASIKLGAPVEPGPIILPRKYGRTEHSRAPVFWHFPWKFRDVERILDGVRHHVACIRAGRLWHFPNDDCRWCPMRTPDLCLPRLQETLELLK